MTAPENYNGRLPEGWTGGASFEKWWRGKLIHLYTLTKPCAQCGSEMRIDVTKGAIEGTAKNAGLHLKRCALCRGKLKALGTASRPTVAGQPSRREIANSMPELRNEALEAANATMKAELAGLYAQNKELRKRLAQYEPKMPWEN
jgi:hypothetical protein